MSTTVALMSASLISSLGSSFVKSQSAGSAGEFQAQIADDNARLANIQAQDAIRRGDIEAKEKEKSAKRLIGAQRAALAAQGLDLEEDNALQIQQDTAEIGAIDALTTKNNAWREAWGFRAQANNFTNQAAFSRVTADNVSRSTLLTGGLSAIGSAAQIAAIGASKTTKTTTTTTG